MDLLFKNPGYFFETYFSFEWTIVIVFFLLLFVISLMRDHSSILAVIKKNIWNIYFAVLLGVTVFNENRIDQQGLFLNPFDDIIEMIYDHNIHVIRGMTSNILLFMPFGICLLSYNDKVKPRDCIIFGISVSIAIECMQYMFRRGYSETTDVICNTLGLVIGLRVFLPIKNVLQMKIDKNNRK